MDIVGQETAEKVRDLSLKIYTEARNYARERGIIIADTKFEFGELDGELILIDEVLTPDSSRFWPLDEYEPGRGQFSFDKQYVRDYLETLDWDKTPPGPALPADRGTLPGSIPRGLRAAHRSGSVNAAVDDFLQHIRLEKGQSAQTQKTYAALLGGLSTGPRLPALVIGKTSTANISRNSSSTNATARPKGRANRPNNSARNRCTCKSPPCARFINTRPANRLSAPTSRKTSPCPAAGNACPRRYPIWTLTSSLEPPVAEATPTELCTTAIL